jgi:hypothetical protein
MFGVQSRTTVDGVPKLTLARAFCFAIPVGDDAWPESATVSIVQDGATVWSSAVSDGIAEGDYRHFLVTVRPDVALEAQITVNGAVLGLFGGSPLYSITTDASDEVYVMPRACDVVHADDAEEGQ